MSKPSLDPRVEKLLSTDTVRAQAKRMLKHALGGGSHFEVDLAKLPACADYVVQTTRKNYPTLEIPFHSRWGHFRAGGVDRVGAVAGLQSDVRALIDLVVVSVLLDAGAGMGWRFKDGDRTLSKSEGLAVASLRMFLQGAFSSDPKKPHQCDARGLKALTARKLEEGFQVSASNPLVGVEGRLGLLHSLADALEKQPEFFSTAGESLPRVGNLFGWYKNQTQSGALPAAQILRGLQLALGSIWPGRLEVDGFNLGDVWRYEPFGEEWVPFHKLSQWLSYSLIEPLIAAGIKVTDADGLTGLPEYRNGGLFLDLEVLKLRDAKLAQKAHRPDSALVIEWRALTVELLERIAPEVRSRLGLSRDQFPLGKVLEGGTWASGRRIAAEKRSDGGPPLQIESDGTVF